MLGGQLTPMMKRTVGNPEIACDLDERLLTRLCKSHRFYLEFLSECSLRLFHGPFPFCGGPLFQVYLPHFLGSRPGDCASRREKFPLEADAPEHIRASLPGRCA